MTHCSHRFGAHPQKRYVFLSVCSKHSLNLLQHRRTGGMVVEPHQNGQSTIQRFTTHLLIVKPGKPVVADPLAQDLGNIFLRRQNEVTHLPGIRRHTMTIGTFTRAPV